MKRTSFSCLLLGCLLFHGSANSAVMELDWKTPGDGLLTFDDVNLREWLDVPLTLSSSGQFPNGVLLELQPGGLLEEFTWAKSSDIIAFAQSAGIDTNTLNFSTNHSVTGQVIDLLGITLGPNSQGDVFSGGRLDEIVPSSGLRVGGIFEVMPSGARAGLFLSSHIDIVGRLATGYLLYREAIPEPPTILLAGILLLYVAPRLRPSQVR